LSDTGFTVSAHVVVEATVLWTRQCGGRDTWWKQQPSEFGLWI
jgi:hypothetical protein